MRLSTILGGYSRTERTDGTAPAGINLRPRLHVTWKAQLTPLELRNLPAIPTYLQSRR